MLPDESDLDLKNLDFDGIAVTAAIDATGTLCPVGRWSIWEKLVGQTMFFGIRIVLVAKDQEGVPPELEKPDAHPLRVIRATTLRDVVTKIHEESRPRQAVCAFERDKTQHLEVFDLALPIQDHYQHLPLLREVRRERLSRESEGKGEAVGEKGIPVSELIRWEEEQRQERVVYERLDLNDLLTSFRRQCPLARSDILRFVVIGPPGSGKSALTQYLAWQAAHGELRIGGKKIVPARVSLRQWERWASMKEEKSLPVFLAALYVDAGRHPPTAEDWRRLLDRGDVLLLLDGLDELEGDLAFDDVVASALTAWRRCPVVLTCRTITFDQHRNVCSDFPVFALAGFDERQRETYIRSFPARHPGKFNADALLERLRLSPQLLSLAANPLLLAIFCYVIDQSRSQDVPATRAAFYDNAVQLLLGKRKKKASRKSLPVIRQRRIMERAALELFLGRGQGQRLIFDEAALLDALERGARAEGLKSAANVADELLRDLPQKPGILRGDSEQGYFFLHLTLQEFLTASALARLVNETDMGWDTVVPAGAKKRSVHEFIDRQAWDPGFENVLLFLAGLLADPEPLLHRLCDESLDDISHHRLGLAGQCLAELSAATRQKHQERIDDVTHRVFARWWKHVRDRTEPLVTPLRRALPSLAQVNGRVHTGQIEPLLKNDAQLSDTMSLLDCFALLLKRADANCQSAALEAVGHVGSGAATTEVLTELTRLLRSQDVQMRVEAAVACGHLGSPAATPDVLTEVIRLLNHNEYDVWSAGANALGSLGPAAATPEILAELIRLLTETGSNAWKAAAQAIGALGTTAATAEGLAEITRLLSDSDADVRTAAAWAIKALGSAAATPEIISQLTRLLDDADLAYAAGEAIQQIGKEAMPYEVLDRLVQRLRHLDPNVRYGGVRTIDALGSAAATPEVLTGLTALLHDPLWQLRFAATRAIGTLESAAATPEILAELSRVLTDQNISVRSAALGTICRLGPAAATPQILSELIRLLRGRNVQMRVEAASACSHLGAAAVSPEVLTELTRMLGGSDRHQRAHTVAAFFHLGTEAASPEVLAEVIRMLRDSDEDVVYRAALACRYLGSAAATPEMLREAIRVLRHQQPYLRSATAEAIFKWQKGGIRFFAPAAGEWSIRTIKKLVQ